MYFQPQTGPRITCLFMPGLYERTSRSAPRDAVRFTWRTAAKWLSHVGTPGTMITVHRIALRPDHGS